MSPANRGTIWSLTAPAQWPSCPLNEKQAFDFRILGALTRAALSAGAVERLADLTIRYTSERRQFGKPVGSFQAVQLHIVTVVEMTALLKIAVHGAAAAVDAGDGSHEVAAAKVVASPRGNASNPCGSPGPRSHGHDP